MNRLFKVSLAAACLAVTSMFVGCGNGASDRALQMVGQDGDKGFMFKKIARGDHTRKYGLFIPISYKPTNKYPVIIFLQGIGEGSGGEGDGKNLTVGIGPFVSLQKDTFPFICIFPQSGGSWSANDIYADDVIAALDDVIKTYSVDQDRVSLTGLSTGGYGTYVIGAKYADRFAAIVPMGSNGKDSSVAPQLTKVAVRAYCSESGDVFAGSNDKDMVDAIRGLGGNAQFISTPTSGHNCWDYVYGSGELFAWLQQQRRQVARPRAGAAAPVSAPVSAPVKAPAVSVAPAAQAAPAMPARANSSALVPVTPY